jgi:hypothetical protein
VNTITIIKDQREHNGLLNINVGLSAFSSEDIIVDVKDIHSIVALGNDNLGVENQDGNVITVNRYFKKSTEKWIAEPRVLTLPGDAFRDRTFVDWILADKTG